jgi:hypothetical protein
LLTALNNPHNEGTRGFPREEQFGRRTGRVWLSLGTRGKRCKKNPKYEGKMPFSGDGWRRSPLAVALSSVISKIAVRATEFFTPSGISEVFTSYSHPWFSLPASGFRLETVFEPDKKKCEFYF